MFQTMPSGIGVFRSSSVRSMTTVIAPPRATRRLRQPQTPAMEKL